MEKKSHQISGNSGADGTSTKGDFELGLEAQTGIAAGQWRIMQRWLRENRPVRREPFEKLKTRFDDLLYFPQLAFDELESITGINFDPVTRSATKVREPQGNVDEPILLWLMTAQVLYEARTLAIRRLESGLKGENLYRKADHPRRGKSRPREKPELALYRSARLAYYSLRSLPRRMALLGRGDLSQADLLMPQLLGWVLPRNSFKKTKRLQEALRGDNFFDRLLASFATALAEQNPLQPLVGRGSILRKAIRDLETERPGNAIADTGLLEEIAVSDEEDFALLAEMREEILALIRRAPLTQAERNVLCLQSEGVSDDAIAARIKINKDSVRVLRSRALSKLKALLDRSD